MIIFDTSWAYVVGFTALTLAAASGYREITQEVRLVDGRVIVRNFFRTTLVSAIDVTDVSLKTKGLGDSVFLPRISWKGAAGGSSNVLCWALAVPTQDESRADNMAASLRRAIAAEASR